MYNILFLLAVIAISCSDISDKGITVTTVADSTVAKEAFITDRTGKKWDISYAYNHYNMDPEQFYYGLGPKAIQPIQNPKFFSSGEQGRPSSSDANMVIGINFQGEQRAYPLYVLKSHEVVNDVINGAPIAVVY